MAKQKAASRIAAIVVASVMLSATFTACKPKPTIKTNSEASTIESSSETVSSEAASSSQAAVSTIKLNTASNVDTTKRAFSAPTYNNNSVFNKKTKAESKIGIVGGFKAPPINKDKRGASIVNRATIEGVDGTFYDPKVNETKMNLNGKTFKFATFWSDNYKTGKGADANRCAQAINEIQKDYNCKITVKQLNGADTEAKNITSAKASGNVYFNILDCLASDGTNLVENNNAGADLRTVKTVGVTTNQWNPVETLVSSFKTRVYGVALRYDWAEQDLLYFNEQLVNKYNLGNLYQMVNSGQWTDDRFLQVSQAFKKYAGKTYTVSTAMYPTHYFNLIYTNWSSPFAYTKTNYIFNGTDGTVLDILTYLQSYFNQGLSDKYYTPADFKADGTFKPDGANDYTRELGLFENGKALFFFGSNGEAVLPEISKSAKCTYGLLPLPKGPTAGDYSTVITNVRYLSLFAGDPDVESSGALLTAIANRTNIKTADITQHNQTFCKDKESIQTLTQNYLHKQIINVELCNAGKLPDIFYGAAANCVFKQSQTPKAAMDSIATKAQTEINAYYG